MKNATVLLSSLALVVALAAGCSTPSTTIIRTWEDATYVKAGFRKVLIVGIFPKAETRRVLEDTFVKELHTRGVAGVASYPMLPETGPQAKERLLKLVKDTAADSVLVLRFSGVTKDTLIVKQPVQAEVQLSRFCANPPPALPQEPDTLVTHQLVSVECRLFCVQTEALAWTGMTKVTDPVMIPEEAVEFAKVIVKALEKKQLVAPAPK